MGFISKDGFLPVGFLTGDPSSLIEPSSIGAPVDTRGKGDDS